MALRQLCRYRLALVDECPDWKRKVIALLDQVFPEYASLFSAAFGVSSKEVVIAYPTPEDMLFVESETLTELLQKASHGRFSHNKADNCKKRQKTLLVLNLLKMLLHFKSGR